MFRRTFALLAATVALSGCMVVRPDQNAAGLGGPAAMDGSRTTSPPSTLRVAILAPLTGPNAERGQSLVQAAQLALSVPGSPALDVKDTGGTGPGAAAAAQQAIAAGAGLIVGPLTGVETAGAAGPAQRAGVPILAFTNDSGQAHAGVWTLGITPAQQVRRLVGASIAEGHSRFGAVLPQNAFGQAMADALGRATNAAGTSPPTIARYTVSLSAMNVAVRGLSGQVDKRPATDTDLKAAPTQPDIAPAGLDCVLLADIGQPLAQVTALLPYYGLQNARVLGPVLWAAPAARADANLNGAWYAAPDPAARTAFDQAFQSRFGMPAPGLADVAYDAASIARVVAQSGGFRSGSLTRPDGFAGVNGVLALNPDGGVRRGLALFEIQRGAPVMVQPSPVSFADRGV